MAWDTQWGNEDASCHDGGAGVDMSRFDAASLIALTGTKETETDGQIPPGCGSH